MQRLLSDGYLPLKLLPRFMAVHVPLAKTSDMTTPDLPGAGKCNSSVCLYMRGIFGEQHYKHLPVVA